MRSLLGHLGVEHHQCFRTHDLRRGHALDMLLNGESWDEIVSRGDWSSMAAPRHAYLPDDAVEARAVMESHLADSSDSSSGEEE